MRSMPSLQRKLVYVVFAFVISFLVYLVLTNNAYQMQQKKQAEQGLGETDGKGSILMGAIKPVENNIQQQEQPAKEKEKDVPLKVEIPEVRKEVKKEPEVPQRHNVQREDEPKLVDIHKQQPAQGNVDIKEAPGVNLHPEPKQHLSHGSGPYSGPQNERQESVVEAFQHAWQAYKKYAWGHDELKPISRGWKEWFGAGLTIVDSLDTMWIMGLKEEFAEGRKWVADSLSFNKDLDVQLFEIVIRELGGLMAAYHLSEDKVFLDKAVELAEGLYPCLQTPAGIPCNRINMKRVAPRFTEISTAESGTIQLEFRSVSRATGEPKYETDLARRLLPCFKGPTPIPCRMANLRRRYPDFEDISTAEVGTVQLEFRAVSRANNVSKYEEAIAKVSNHLHGMKKLDGLVACFINAQTGTFRTGSTVSAGASADSYYEYLVKQWIQTGKTQDWLKNDYLESIAGIKKHLYKYSHPSHWAFVGALHSMSGRGFRPEMEHLTCFLPGTLALGYIHGLGGEDHLNMAKELGHTCYQMYNQMPTGLSPEVAAINISPSRNQDISVNYGAHYNLQRPETVESLFYLYRATKDPIYREWGWKIFQAFEKYTRVANGYASIDNVRSPEHVGYRDKMETFYLAETLKYLYLLFSDDPELIPLDKWVINTEAHPLPVYSQ